MPCEQQLQPNEVNGVKESWDMLKMYLIFHLDLYMKINHRRNLTKRQALFLMNMRRWTVVVIAQLLLITLMMAPFCSSVPVSHDNVGTKPGPQSPPMTCQNVLWKQYLGWCCPGRQTCGLFHLFELMLNTSSQCRLCRQQYYDGISFCQQFAFDTILDDEIYLCTLPLLLSTRNLKAVIYQEMYSE